MKKFLLVTFLAIMTSCTSLPEVKQGTIEDKVDSTGTVVKVLTNYRDEISKTYGKVLSVMKSQVGSPYVFGGAGETITRSLLNKLKSQYPTMNYNLDSKYIDSNYRAFDCSGLMQWAFKQVGINIGRSTYNQINNGVEVSLNNLKEGDLLFYSDFNHVGMYVGNGQWLESPRSGEFVRISNVPWNKIGRARRILK